VIPSDLFLRFLNKGVPKMKIITAGVLAFPIHKNIANGKVAINKK
jgi:hypothetical protein